MNSSFETLLFSLWKLPKSVLHFSALKFHVRQCWEKAQNGCHREAFYRKSCSFSAALSATRLTGPPLSSPAHREMARFCIFILSVVIFAIDNAAVTFLQAPPPSTHRVTHPTCAHTLLQLNHATSQLLLMPDLCPLSSSSSFALNNERVE